MELLNETNEKYLKALVYGDCGVGKTSLAATCPSPLVLLSERHGATSLMQAAERNGVERPTTLHMRSLTDYRNVIVGLRGDKSKPFKVLHQGKTIIDDVWPQTVVLDSLTDACRLIEDEIRTSGKDTETMSIPQYGTLKVRAERMISAFRDAPCHVLFLCLMDDKGEGLDRTLRPKLPGRGLPDFAAASVNVVAVADRKVIPQKDGAEALVEYRAWTIKPGPYMLKPMRPLRDFEEMNFSKWVNKIFGETKEVKETK